MLSRQFYVKIQLNDMWRNCSKKLDFGKEMATGIWNLYLYTIISLRITFLDSLCNSATGGQSKGLNFLKLSDDRDVWRGMVANVCSRSGT